MKTFPSKVSATPVSERRRQRAPRAIPEVTQLTVRRGARIWFEIVVEHGVGHAGLAKVDLRRWGEEQGRLGQRHARLAPTVREPGPTMSKEKKSLNDAASAAAKAFAICATSVVSAPTLRANALMPAVAARAMSSA